MELVTIDMKKEFPGNYEVIREPRPDQSTGFQLSLKFETDYDKTLFVLRNT